MSNPSRLLPMLLVLIVASPVASRAEEPSQTPQSKEETVECAVIETSEGKLVVRLFPGVAPKAVENFKALAEENYYEGVIFHRVIEGFMIQGGDPSGTGYGGRSKWGKAFEDEFSSDLRFDRKGLLAMANSGPNTNQSQFFITLAPTPWLNDLHTIFGEVVGGMDVLETIGNTETDPRDKPIKEVVIGGVSIEDCDVEN